MAGGADGSDARRAEAARRNNPMNRLVPYLDLFMRLDDAEMSRLAGVEVELVATLRRQVVEISEGLATYLDLLPRLSDDELVRLTGASAKTVRFWRLCQPKGSPARTSELAARAEISSITPMPRPAPEPPAAPRDDQPTAMRRRTTGVGLQATMVQGAAPAASQSQSQPVANWSHEASSTNAATTITPPPHQVPEAAWDTTSPTSGTATMVTPITQVPASWGQPVPSETTTLPAASSRAPRPSASAGPVAIDPADSQAAAARALDINGEPFPGFEWRPASDEDAFSLSELDS
jgi:hypothetical protein